MVLLHVRLWAENGILDRSPDWNSINGSNDHNSDVVVQQTTSILNHHLEQKYLMVDIVEYQY